MQQQQWQVPVNYSISSNNSSNNTLQKIPNATTIFWSPLPFQVESCSLGRKRGGGTLKANNWRTLRGYSLSLFLYCYIRVSSWLWEEKKQAGVSSARPTEHSSCSLYQINDTLPWTHSISLLPPFNSSAVLCTHTTHFGYTVPYTGYVYNFFAHTTLTCTDVLIFLSLSNNLLLILHVSIEHTVPVLCCIVCGGGSKVVSLFT